MTIDWRDYRVPPTRREGHFGDHVVTYFAERPHSVQDMFAATVGAYGAREAG